MFINRVKYYIYFICIMFLSGNKVHSILLLHISNSFSRQVYCLRATDKSYRSPKMCLGLCTETWVTYQHPAGQMYLFYKLPAAGTRLTSRCLPQSGFPLGICWATKRSTRTWRTSLQRFLNSCNRLCKSIYLCGSTTSGPGSATSEIITKAVKVNRVTGYGSVLDQNRFLFW